MRRNIRAHAGPHAGRRRRVSFVIAQTDFGAAPGFQPLGVPAGVTAKAVYVEDATSGAALYSLAADERRSPASTTKLMTALVIANNTTDWQELVTADASDVLTADDGESFMGLLDGDVLTVEQLMYGLMLSLGQRRRPCHGTFYRWKTPCPGGDATGIPRSLYSGDEQHLVCSGFAKYPFHQSRRPLRQDHYTSARDLATSQLTRTPVPQVATASAPKPTTSLLKARTRANSH